ncbi:MAG: hypothetical protein EXR98_17920 [Gemmataceae bacterium]|nr:hypothetical protein [Gemmataceae bacterium]
MALRFTYAVLALTLILATGCRTRSNYRPACAPAIVATNLVQPPCPPGQLPPPPPVLPAR